eukprot:m.66868 g.66868  ORF g.66868 m.66868 type:complete len:115 (+) comp9835_c0_seq2:204-548(+)
MAGSPPVSRLDWPLTVDPRKWDEFTRHTLVGGDLTPDKDVNKHATKSPKDTYKREPSQFDHWVYPPGTSKVEMVAEPGRYHLFVAGVCKMPYRPHFYSARSFLSFRHCGAVINS